MEEVIDFLETWHKVAPVFCLIGIVMITSQKELMCP